ncbi:molybdenum containing formylmethanofuran dehydrogenase, subunit B [Methanococcus vannielii SB]|uniref:formylmethanofuran dehydrogenase subunit B n=1 Tax=Methanococcus vannielii (strain ATCC 35089 / DSM 1224 / JCM 13029 / OCM 148 / SB) TaxID=406327 RepID=A6UST4_METVS|nr:formylmethanofuran dehydrogenase subunit B [Methanococcus vannielii]ABR55556.1 molybdenum containing formylmethanofuran dehydrogenase, subunit B [Methanococcus vannielii SB]
MASQTFKDIICPVCGGACDDIEVVWDEETRDLTVRNACKMGAAKFGEVISHHRIMSPQIRKNGVLVDVSWDEAIEKAAEILANSKRPLLYMGAETSCEAMEVGLHMGEYIGGIVDSCSTVCHGPSLMGVQEAGKPGATAGETMNRADVVIYWGTNPMDSMPRHLSKYALFPKGYFVEKGRLGRTVITVDPRRTATAKASDIHVQLKPNSDYEMFSALLMAVRGKMPHPSVEKVTGVPVETILQAAEIIKNSKFTSIYGGLGLPASDGRHRNIECVLTLVKELQRHTKVTIGLIRGHCNVAGFNVLASYLYGFPFGLDFARGYPRYNPGEYTANDVLREKEVDAALIMASDVGAHYPQESVSHLKDIPVITLDIAPCPSTSVADVVLPGVLDALECDGTFYRFDEIPIYFKPFTKSPFTFTQSNEDTLKQLFKRVKELREQKK